MRFFIITLLLASTVLLCCKTEAQNMKRAKHFIDTLASPSMHGRGYVKQGDKKAARFIRNQFKKAGLKSFGSDFFQPFEININTFPGTVSLRLDGKKLELGKDFIMHPASAGGKGTTSIRFPDTTLLQKSTDEITVTDSLIYVLSPAFREKLSNHSKLKAKFYTQSKALILLKKKNLIAGLSNKQVPVPVFLAKTSSVPPEAQKAAFSVKARLKKNYKTQNVAGYIPGKTKKDSFIVISAHYDHLGSMGNIHFPGANDNASGTAMMLELAHYFSKKKNQPDYSIAFIAFGGEEAGLKGSKHWVNHPPLAHNKIRCLINMDMVGTGEDGINIVNGKNLPRGVQLLRKINSKHNYLPEIKTRKNAPNSDHYFFTQKGVKACFIYTLGESGKGKYHNIHDTADNLPMYRFPELFNLTRTFIQEL